MSGWLSGCCDSSDETDSSEDKKLTIDLTISDVVASLTSVNPGDSILVNFRVNNAGSRLARSSTADLYLSGDTTIDISDVKVGSCSVSQIEERSFIDLSCPATISADQAPGNYYLGVIADATYVISESNENNNTGYDPAGFKVANIVTSVSAGAGYTCALLSSGSVMCWGYNHNGQLGNGTTIGSNVPVFVSGITTATAITANVGGEHTCALLSSGSVMCWGRNHNGQLGDGTTTGSNVPVFVSGITTATAITAGGAPHTCALLSDGSIECWGYNGYGQLGDGTRIASKVPVFVSGITNAIAVTAGGRHTCALLVNGSVMCWGYNYFGQLGNRTTGISLVPVFVSEITTAIGVSAGNDHTCALLANSLIKCWGYNGYGQLGDGTRIASDFPAFVSGITTATSLDSGYVHTCTLLSSDSIMCWGDNTYGQLGNGTTTGSYIPIFVSGITSATGVSAGLWHTCALLSSGSIMCWGKNNIGQLGNGTWTDSNVPVQVIGL